MLISYQEWKIKENYCAEHNQIKENVFKSLKSMMSPKVFMDKIKFHYQRLKDKYGETWAKMIISAALLGLLSPIPGSSFLAALPIVGLAEIFKWLKKNPDKAEEINSRYSDETEKIIKDLQPT